jgi:hypothetical protein
VNVWTSISAGTSGSQVRQMRPGCHSIGRSRSLPDTPATIVAVRARAALPGCRTARGFARHRVRNASGRNPKSPPWFRPMRTSWAGLPCAETNRGRVSGSEAQSQSSTSGSSTSSKGATLSAASSECVARSNQRLSSVERKTESRLEPVAAHQHPERGPGPQIQTADGGDCLLARAWYGAHRATGDAAHAS